MMNKMDEERQRKINEEVASLGRIRENQGPNDFDLLEMHERAWLEKPLVVRFLCSLIAFPFLIVRFVFSLLMATIAGVALVLIRLIFGRK